MSAAHAEEAIIKTDVSKVSTNNSFQTESKIKYIFLLCLLTFLQQFQISANGHLIKCIIKCSIALTTRKQELLWELCTRMCSIKHKEHTHESLLLMVRIQTVILYSIDMKINRQFTANKLSFANIVLHISFIIIYNIIWISEYIVNIDYCKNIAKLLFHLFYAIYFQSFLNY